MKTNIVEDTPRTKYGVYVDRICNAVRLAKTQISRLEIENENVKTQRNVFYVQLEEANRKLSRKDKSMLLLLAENQKLQKQVLESSHHLKYRELQLRYLSKKSDNLFQTWETQGFQTRKRVRDVEKEKFLSNNDIPIKKRKRKRDDESRSDKTDVQKTINAQLNVDPQLDIDSIIDSVIDSVMCKKCTRGNDECNILLCDRCDDGYHMYCLDSPLKTVPENDWYCPKCDHSIK